MQAPTGLSLLQTAGRAIQLVSLSAAAIWLMLLIAASVSVAVITFSATQFQTRWANLTLNGGALSVWKAEQLREQWAASLNLLETAKKALDDNRQYLSKAIGMRNAADRERTLAGQQLSDSQASFAEKIARVDTDLATKFRTAAVDQAPSLVYGALDGLKDKDPSIEQDLTNFVALREKYYTADNKLNQAKSEVESLSGLVDQGQKELQAAQKGATLSLAGPDGEELPADQRTPIENAIYEFNAMHSYLWGLVYKFALAPSDILVLILVISMGVLGSSLQLGYVYTTEYARKSAIFYIFRPFLGVITALVVFIVTKAGLPLVTDAGKLGGNAPINPYFISFLGIISGLLSERALEAVRQLGASYFRGGNEDGDPPRWARVNLAAEFATAHRDAEALRRQLTAKESEWSDWIQGKEPLPGSVQRMISIVIDKPRRDLFTDIAPDDAAEPGGGQPDTTTAHAGASGAGAQAAAPEPSAASRLPASDEQKAREPDQK